MTYLTRQILRKSVRLRSSSNTSNLHARTATRIQHKHLRRLSFHSKSSLVTCSTGSLSQFGNALFLYTACTQASWVQRYNTEKHNQSILACSSSINNDEEPHKRFLERVLNRLKAIFKRIWETWLVSLRSAEVAIRMSPLLILTPAAMATSRLIYNDQEGDTDIVNNPMVELSWWYTLKQLQALGPAFVKLAQWIATRRDIFPPEICNQFSKLHDRGFTHHWKHTHKSLREAFGSDYEKKGLHIDPKDVIGCGSAAQVYRGTLDTATDEQGNKVQRRVAVKVLHPRFQELVERDLRFMESAANLLHSLPFIEHIKWLNLPRATQNFGFILRRQADLKIEGENLTKFRHNFYGETNAERLENDSSIRFPRPLEGWTNEDVLVQDLVQDSIPIGEYLKDDTEEGLAIRRELAGPLLRAFLKMVFIDNFVHCDLHPGNVLVQRRTVVQRNSLFSNWAMTRTEVEEASTKNIEYTIVFLDAGIATSLSENDQRNLKDLFRAVILNDGNQAGRLMVERAAYERCTEKEGGVESFAKGVEDIVAEFHDRRKKGLTLGAVRIGHLLSKVLDLCRMYGVEVDPAMASIVISTLVLEGLGRSLEPEMNLIDCAAPFVLGRGTV